MNQCLTPPAAEFGHWGLRGQSRVTAAANFALRGERVQWHRYAGAGAMKRVSQCEYSAAYPAGHAGTRFL